MKIDFSWKRLYSQWLKDAKLAFFIVGILMTFRLVMLGLFINQRSDSDGFLDFISFLFRALQFDLRVGLTVVVPTVLISLLLWGMPFFDNWVKRLRLLIGAIVTTATVLLCIVNVGYFYEFHDQYNHYVYGLIYDDLDAIMATTWDAYPIIWITLGATFLCFLSLVLYKRWMRYKLWGDSFLQFFNKNAVLKVFITLITLVLFSVGLRGSIQSRPLQRDDIAATPDIYLNKLVPNPYFSLYYTYSDHKHLGKAAALDMFLEDGSSLVAALKKIFPNENIESNDLDLWMQKKVDSPEPSEKPKHIFLIVLESQDSWPMLEEYEELNLVPNLKELAKDGLWVKSFVSSGTTTRTSLNAIISGLPDAYVYTNFQPNSEKTYPTAIAKQFKELGYQTNLFYGGHLTWQRLGEFSKNQGFENVYGQEHMPLHVHGGSWGVFDEYLFDYILNTVDPDVPSFNLIMTTSNHSPYPVDLEAKNCPLFVEKEKFEPLLKDSVTKPQILGHLWYNDLCTGDFVQKAKDKFGAALFAITGDHASRRYFKSRPPLYEEKSVPLILYGPNTLKDIEISPQVAGSHLDIAPTLIELVAPKGFMYKSLGSDLLNPQSPMIGLGADVVITPKLTSMAKFGETHDTHPWTQKDTEISEAEIKDLHARYNALHAIGWWRIIKGPEIVEEKKIN